MEQSCHNSFVGWEIRILAIWYPKHMLFNGCLVKQPFLCNDLESSNWNNQKKTGCLEFLESQSTSQRLLSEYHFLISSTDARNWNVHIIRFLFKHHLLHLDEYLSHVASPPGSYPAFLARALKSLKFGRSYEGPTFIIPSYISCETWW